jgi:hypothetical protein
MRQDILYETCPNFPQSRDYNYYFHFLSPSSEEKRITTAKCKMTIHNNYWTTNRTSMRSRAAWRHHQYQYSEYSVTMLRYHSSLYTVTLVSLLSWSDKIRKLNTTSTQHDHSITMLHAHSSLSIVTLISLQSWPDLQHKTYSMITNDIVNINVYVQRFLYPTATFK